ncbi:MAG TPA: NYN domain-containing protein [Solirubrobacteraceae bacterium]|jgi:uncharacterized LabA/DUF88 family protein
MSGGFFAQPQSMARNLSPDARVLVFVDGQNAYKACERLFRHGACHPLLLADRVRAGRRLVGVRYYSGVHDATVDGRARSRADRRHNMMRTVGVTVIERPLRYRWEWGFDPRLLPDPMKNQGQQVQVTVTPFQRAREKGIDLSIGLDVIDLALRGAMDVAVIVSSDNDLCEAARATHQATARSRVSVEAAVFNGGRTILLPHYDYTHQLRQTDFVAAEDSFDYTQPVAPAMAQVFAASCAELRTHFGAAAPRGSN